MSSMLSLLSKLLPSVPSALISSQITPVLLILLLLMCIALLVIVLEVFKILRNGFKENVNSDSWAVYGGSVKETINKQVDSFNGMIPKLLAKIEATDRTLTELRLEVREGNKTRDSVMTMIEGLESKNQQHMDGLLFLNSSKLVKSVVEVISNVNKSTDLDATKQIVNDILGQALEFADFKKIPDEMVVDRALSEVHQFCRPVGNLPTSNQSIHGNVAEVVLPGYYTKSSMGKDKVAVEAQVRLYKFDENFRNITQVSGGQA